MAKKLRFKWRDQNDPETDEQIGNAVATYNTEPSLTQQQFTQDVDLNETMRRYGVSDQAIPPAAFPEGSLVIDYTQLDGLEYRDVLDRMRTAQENFQQLPAELRARFLNRPENLWDFVNDPRNHEEAVRIGLLQRSETPLPSSTDATTRGSGGSTEKPATAETTSRA